MSILQVLSSVYLSRKSFVQIEPMHFAFIMCNSSVSLQVADFLEYVSSTIIKSRIHIPDPFLQVICSFLVPDPSYDCLYRYFLQATVLIFFITVCITF